MTLEETQDYFGSLYKACKALGLKKQNIVVWRKNGSIPLLQQYRIAELTEGTLMPDEENPAEIRRNKRYSDAKKTIK